MKNIKKELKEVIVDTMLPESEEYLKELNIAIKNKTANPDEIEAKKDVESFIEELKNILEVIAENKLSNEDSKNVYDKIITMLNEHDKD